MRIQPFITLAESGQGGKVRTRMMQQLSFRANPSMGAAVYENVVVKEGGKWKCASTHAYSTWTASYKGGWVQNPGKRVPVPSESFPPDAPPSFTFAMFPTVYPFPYYYPNPVSGR